MMQRAFWASFFSVLVYNSLVRPRWLRWGISTAEAHASYIGDTLVPRPTVTATRAITIHATPAHIWPWLAQMGRQRSGYYGIDRLDNWNIPSVRYLRQDIPPLAVGMMLDDGLQVLDFVANKFLLFGGFNMPNDLGGRSDFVYLYQLSPLHKETTRLLIRARLRSDGWQGWLFDRIYEVLDYRMVVARLHGIKARVEVHPPEIVSRETIVSAATASAANVQ